MRASFWLALALGLLLAGCGAGSSANDLEGSLKEAYSGLGFTHVTCTRQEDKTSKELVAMIVQYLDDKDYIQVKVIANKPVVAGQARDLANNGGAVIRAVPDGSAFPALKNGNITFDNVSNVGGTCSGQFFLTFQADLTKGQGVENTLTGHFSATLQLAAM
jgi:hypothetical protein